MTNFTNVFGYLPSSEMLPDFFFTTSISESPKQETNSK